MRLQFTKRFHRSYKKLDPQAQIIIKKALKQMEEDPTHPSLRIKKMEGYKNPYVWEASGNMNLRITFEMEKPESFILRNCGHHDNTLNNP
ncbi:cytotoxin [Metabacillus rhizolycopersici]|uniref:Cytotoxin n=1 Tax=Metabacillus rhizolycopersici TaxID=2875709 RepID=A0ABS7V0I6_9BACI|nr:cytotoxin [Metabacillus rhizolycopersici]MBZ5753707.1 cytotoxin [Metabacillus rhizolycopersici]